MTNETKLTALEIYNEAVENQVKHDQHKLTDSKTGEETYTGNFNKQTWTTKEAELKKNGTELFDKLSKLDKKKIDIELATFTMGIEEDKYDEQIKKLKSSISSMRAQISKKEKQKKDLVKNVQALQAEAYVLSEKAAAEAEK